MTDVPDAPEGDARADDPGSPAAPRREPRSDADRERARERRRRRRQRQRRRRVLAVFVVLLLLVVGVLGGGWWWVQRQVDPGGRAGPVVSVVIPKGSSTADIGKLLHQKGVVPNGNVFRYWVSYRNKGPFEAGTYRLPTHISADRAIEILAKGPPPVPVVRVPIPEGFTVKQIVARLHSRVPRFSVAAIRAALADGSIESPYLPGGTHDYEGLLYPATYDVVGDESLTRVLSSMTGRLAVEARSLGLDAGAARLKLSPYQVIVVASLVQAEAGNPDEAPKIARVIYNRLAQGTPLGVDATSRYLSSITGDAVDFESTSPYNTRRRAGLPPTPITAPGEFALRAALHPADGTWIYYVRDVHNDAKGRPQHVFTTSESEFERAKQACHDAGLGCG